MAVVWCEEMAAGTTASGNFGESVRLSRRWKIRVDDPLTSKVAIVAAASIVYGQAHPTVSAFKMMEWDLGVFDGVGMMWILNAIYYVPPRDRDPGNNGVPKDYWDATGGTRTVPLFRDVTGEIITNSAGDPLEGLEKERNDFGFTLHKFYETEDWKEDARTFSGSVNDATWGGGDAKTWKVEFKSGTMRTVYGIGASAGAKDFVETVWDFRHEPDTWKCKPWDVGFNERCDSDGVPTGSGTSRKPIVGADKKRVGQPVALAGGVALPPGTPPQVINNGDGVDVYPENDFAGKFGSPQLLPAPPAPPEE